MTYKLKVWRITAGLSFALLLTGGKAILAAGVPAKPNVLVFVLDQLRADQLHCYGNPRQDSPNIDGLAQRGVRFARYYTVASWTSPSFGSLHTSLFPSRHGVTLFWRPGMPLINKDVPTLAEDFKYHGYYTAAFVNNGLAGQGLTGRGFDEYHEGYTAPALNITERVTTDILRTSTTAAEVSTWLGKHRSQTFFLYVHFMSPHSPYDPPPEDDIFKSDAYPYMTNTGYDVAQGGLLRLAMLGDRNAVERLYQLYDGKIHFVDRYVGQILGQLQSLGLNQKTVVLLTSDHGELLYSHPRDFLTFDHRSLYDTVLHIPLIVAGPGVPQGRVLDGLGSNIDTAPTLLDLAGLPPLSDAEGHSLLPMIEGKTASINEYVYSEEDVAIPLRAVRSTRYKLILNLWTGKERLFDLQNDPAELTDVAQAHPEAVKELDSQLEDWMKDNMPSKAVQLRRWRIYTAPERVTVIDDQTIGGRFLITGGGWHSDTAPGSGNFDGGCFWTTKGDGSRTAVWRNDDPMLGAYNVFVYYGRPSIGRLASDAPFTIVYGPAAVGGVVSDTSSKTVRVNFNQGAGDWQLLGTVRNPRYVEESDAADGTIIADAIRFERVAP
ncbi:MAG TPA: sulfatase-like hydrolase/transferase [Terriglobia bacterium]|nr:sulfatase-like hydrolase/transferase [Terriglobia bacterium]